MPNRRPYFHAVLFATVVFALGCSATHAPRGVLSKPAELHTEAYGGWVHLELDHEFKEPVPFVFGGELIAVSEDSVFVLGEDKFHALPVVVIKKARLVVYDSQAGSAGGPAIAGGTLVSLSHGFWWVLTAPILWWSIGGTAVGARLREPMLDYPRRPIADFRQYARFPQGLPPALNRQTLQRKPVQRQPPRKRY